MTNEGFLAPKPIIKDEPLPQSTSGISSSLNSVETPKEEPIPPPLPYKEPEWSQEPIPPPLPYKEPEWSQEPIPPPLPYKEPEWSQEPTQTFYFEIIKNGQIVGKSGIVAESMIVAGRIPVCDIELEHASASRYHAVIQFKANIAFLYDLDSSHGTFLNKKQIEPRKYMKLNVGDMIKFGASSRIYILQGPQEYLEKKEQVLDNYEQQKIMAMEKEKELEVSWGFKNDAYEGDEWNGIDITGPVDRSLIPEDAFYLKDPKKSLTIFLDKNGADSQITYQEANKEFTATLEISGLEGPLSATGKGKKKGQAERDAYIEACFKLEKLGILNSQRGSTTERSKRLREEYLEEEQMNEYLDQTAKAKKAKSEGNVETFESLSLKKQEILDQLTVLNTKLEESGSKSTANAEDEEDELDAFMATVKQKLVTDNQTKFRKEIAELEKELESLEKLIKLAAPKGSLNSKPLNTKKNVQDVKEKVDPKPIIKKIRDSSDPKQKMELIDFSKMPSPVNEFQDDTLVNTREKGDILKDKTVKTVKMPSKAEMKRYAIQDDVVDFIPPDERVSQEELEKRSSSYGY